MPLLKVLWAEAYTEATIRLMGYVREDTHSVGSETGSMTPWATMSLRVHFICLGTLWIPSNRHVGWEGLKGQS